MITAAPLAAQHAARLSDESNTLARAIVRATDDTRRMEQALTIAITVTRHAETACLMAAEAEEESDPIRASRLTALAIAALDEAAIFHGLLVKVGRSTNVRHA